eukprot:SAG11_NODE_723_length_7528_cov_4.998385_9_plen_151_part_00
MALIASVVYTTTLILVATCLHAPSKRAFTNSAASVAAGTSYARRVTIIINFPLNKGIFGATEQGWSSFACVKKYTPVGPGVLVKDYTTPTCSGPSPFVTTFFQPGCFNGPPNSRRSFSTTANRTDFALIQGEHKGCTGLFKETGRSAVGP